MITGMAGKDFVASPGDIVNLDNAEACRLLAAGHALPVREDVVETATAKPVQERAVKGKRKP